jgi:dienelactone hydrolase
MKMQTLVQSVLMRLSILTVSLGMFCVAVSGRQPTSQPSTEPAQETRDALLAIIDRPRVDLSPQETSQGVEGDLARFHFTYASEATQRVPGILLAKPGLLKDGRRHPVVIVLHGTGGSKMSEIGTLRTLADDDFIAVSIDGRFHGERGTQADYNAAIAQAFADGKSHPLYLDTVWDVMRLIDYLQSRVDVDPNRIGLMGISKGGIETWLTAAVDPRVGVAIPCISAQSFAWGLENNAWHHRIGTVQKSFDAAAKAEGIDKPDATFVKAFYDRLLPGITTRFDGPQMLPLIAPRPLLIISGEKDPINPIRGVRLCETSTKLAYANAKAGDRFEIIIEPNITHEVTKSARAAAVEWFKKWLMHP